MGGYRISRHASDFASGGFIILIAAMDDKCLAGYGTEFCISSSLLGVGGTLL